MAETPELAYETLSDASEIKDETTGDLCDDAHHEVEVITTNGDKVEASNPNGDRVFTMDDLAYHLKVSAKTISRWRKEGLMTTQVVINGRERVGFLQSEVERFVAHNRDHVHRAMTYTRSTEDEKANALRDVDAMLQTGLPVLKIITTLMKKYRRSHEWVRQLVTKTLKQYTTANGQLNEYGIKRFYEEFRRGKSIAVLAQQYGIDTKVASQIVNQARVARIFELPLDYMSSPDFTKSGADERILASTPTSPSAQRMPKKPKDLPAYIASLYDVPLLTVAQETHLFRKYNFLKYKTWKLRDELDQARPKAQLLDEIESLYQDATETKNHLIRANMRLVVAVAKKYIGSTGDLFDKVSEGNFSLMRAVEKFDYTRGFKFSTYATWAIKKNYIRAYQNEIKQSDRFRSGHEEVLEAQHDSRTNETTELVAQLRREDQVADIMQRLTDRERQIISSRFGIGTGREPMTLKDVGVELGVSKERVRQIETRALQKLRMCVIKKDHKHDKAEIDFELDDELPEQSDRTATGELSDWKIEGKKASYPKLFSEQRESEGKKMELLFAQDAAISLRVPEADLPQYLNTYVFNGQHYFTLEEIEVFLHNRHRGEAKDNGTTPKSFTLINKRLAVRMLGRKKYNDREPQLTNYHLRFKRGTERDLFCLEEVNTY